MDPNTIQPSPQPQQFQPAAPMPQQPVTFGAPVQLPPDHSRRGFWLILSLVVVSVLLVAAAVFAIWAFMGRQDYKNNSDTKVAAAVSEAEQKTTEENNARYAEEAKNPLKSFTGPSSYGSIKLEYPKTWSGYVTAKGSGSSIYNAYFHPDVVPDVTASGDDRQAIALHIEVQSKAYDSVIKSYDNAIKNGRITASPYELPKVEGQVGMQFTGQIDNDYTGTQYVLPLRDKTLVVTTMTDQYMSDITTYILPNLSFVP